MAKEIFQNSEALKIPREASPDEVQPWAKSLGFRLSTEQSTQVFKLAREMHSTPMNLLMAVFFGFLGRKLDQEQLVLGVPFAHQPQADFEKFNRSLYLYAASILRAKDGRQLEKFS